MAGGILERDSELAALSAAVEAAAHHHGSVVLVSGEAGIGKSSLVTALRQRLPADGRLLIGYCDDLATPRLLGPLRDLAGRVGAELSRALRDPGDRDGLFAALLAELDWRGHATVLVVEDVQWADEATLDVLRYLVRRVPDLDVVLVLTYRDDLAADHPLRRLLATAGSTRDVRRLPLRPLSPAAVRRLASGTQQDPSRVHTLTGGNPFFVAEVLGSGRDDVPASVVDSVLARLDGLGPDARDAVERLCVLTSTTDRSLVDALLPAGFGVLASAEERGLLSVTPDAVGFRHELVRRAVLDALPGSRRAALDAAALAVLERAATTDLAQLVHHAARAGDAAAVVRYGPDAARTAAAGRSHREAAAHYRLVLEHRSSFSEAELADLLEASAIQGYIVGDHGRSARDDQEESVALRRQLGEPVALGAALRWLSRICWWFGDGAAAQEAGGEAVALLTGTADRGQLALALSNQSQLAMLAENNAEAADLARRAITIARELGDREVLTHALNNLGTALWDAGDPAGRGLVEESLEVARSAGLAEHAARSACNLAWSLLKNLEIDAAELIVTEGIAHAERAEHVMFWKYLHATGALLAVDRCRWDEALDRASHGLEGTPHVRAVSTLVLAKVAVRTGADAAGHVETVLELGRELQELQRLVPAVSVACEAAWLAGDLDRVRELAGPVHERAAALRVVHWQAETAWWLSVAGLSADPGNHRHPFAVQARGEWLEAARLWRSVGRPHDEAVALACADDPAVVLEGLGRLDALGAAGTARWVRGRLREQGVDRIPRGPSATSRANVAGLTSRQAEVLSLLAQGLSNAQISVRLVLSVRTVDHHVAAVLEKLGASSRAEAVLVARAGGWAPPAP